MQSNHLLASLAALALFAAGPALADNDHHDNRDRHDRHHTMQSPHADATDQGMREVVNGASEGEPAYGWRYFADAGEHRAVVISPQGDYYFSRGKGPRWVAAAPKSA